jgi:hypothetical protein
LHVIGSVLQGRDVDDEGKEEEHAWHLDHLWPILLSLKYFRPKTV